MEWLAQDSMSRGEDPGAPFSPKEGLGSDSGNHLSLT